jgi:hypothetical protein
MSQSKTFRWIKVGGLLTLIPLFLASGPLAGYLAGDWIVKTFGLSRYVTLACVITGFAASVSETVKVIKIALKTAQDNE